MNHVHPVFASTLAAFSGQPLAPKPPHKILIAIDPFEVELPSTNPRDPETWRTVRPSDQAIKEAVEKVLSYPSVIDMIEAELVVMLTRVKA
jgi:hypothetical protein